MTSAAITPHTMMRACLALIAGAVAANPVTAAGNIAGDVQAQAATEVKTGFSPGGTALNLVLDSIDHAQHEILVAAYSLTSRPVAGALRAAKKRGVSVVVVADRKANDNRYTEVNFLANNRVAVRINDNYEAMHDKFMVFDRRAVLTGSSARAWFMVSTGSAFPNHTSAERTIRDQSSNEASGAH